MSLFVFFCCLFICKRDQLPRLGKRQLICLLLFTCNYVVSVFGEVSSSSGCLGWATLFYIILLWHSMSLPHNYFELVQILWLCSLTAKMKKIRSKMKALEC